MRSMQFTLTGPCGPTNGMNSIQLVWTLRNYTLYDKYAASVKGECLIYSNIMSNYLYNDTGIGRGSSFPHRAHAELLMV